MHKFIQQIDTFFGAHPAERYVVACSGGVDSMVLAHLMMNQSLPVELAHVNYGLRDEASDGDQFFLEEFCKTNGIPFHCKRIDLKTFLLENGGNLQEEARKVRYAFFDEIIAKNGGKLVLAQHADDQVETFLLNLVRGGGMMGLSGMLEQNGNCLRPLLSFRKQQLLDYAREKGLTWREDRSNAESTYSRNKLRNIILPKLKEIQPDFVDHVLVLMQVFQENQAVLANRIASKIKDFPSENTISINAYKALDDFEKIELLRQFSIPVGMLTEVNKLATSEKGKVLNFSGEFSGRLIREWDGFYVERDGMKEQKQSGILVIEPNATLPTEFSKSDIYLNPELISGELQLRTWQLGDRMKPIGMKGSKLISDILTDAKVPHHMRHTQYVVADKQRILWCVGLAVSREAIATLGGPCIKVTVND
ncbi:MAG: tRNA lysidine(34) synthetase TilS [Bacteroidota bacterium]